MLGEWPSLRVAGVPDPAVVALALVAVVGAALALPVPLWLGGGVAATGLALRRPAVLCAGVLLLATGLGHRAVSGLRPLPPDRWSGVATLVSDPEPIGSGVRALVATPEGRFEARAFGSPARRLRPRLAGERVALAGRHAPPHPAAVRRLAVRHARGILTVDAVGGWSVGAPASRAANRVRRHLAHGARTLPPAERALYLGLVLGDDRNQDEASVAAFRGSGLSHLLAVSGQNVAYLLAVVAPALGRLGRRPRWVATVAVIAWFALLTRFEPSVLRASAMAGLAATSVLLGRPASTLRLLALCVAGLVLVDPLLVRSVGWWLSVGATAGIAGCAAPLEQRLPGPRPLVSSVAVTAAAQAGVAPVSITVFGGMPLAAVPANVLAGPVAGLVMLVGLPAGAIAAVLPDGLARIVQLPVLLGVRWVALVARLGAALPLGEIRLPQAVAFAVVGALVLGRSEPAARRVAAVIAALAVASTVTGWPG
jgi:competence protein ComEC